ncbi:F-box protein At5g07610-like isoform X2 [Triticum dicoccoides]|uniref:F-box protein At5g07610-like isoform X2 n=1 Tax=Triticum dicoccoides TaxID=85692 RepID=UPI000E7D09D1|nr:F-box protein At5g07610-like isoform X2 [Triticum dicoccoides]
MSSSSPRTAMARDSKKKKKKRLKGSPVSKLTDDILADIISRVPYKSTCCCKCVSTRWRDLISYQCRNKMPQSIVGFFYEGYNEFRSPKKARYFTNLSRQRYPLVDPSLSFLPNCESLDILDSCNGLLLCRCWKVTDPKTLDYVVCNPTTQKLVAVPATDWSSMVSVARLGFDPAVSSHFHVFEFIDEESWGISEDELDGDCCGRIETLAIYSSKAGAWKYQTVEHGRFSIPKNSGRLYFADSDGSKLSIWVLEDYVTGKWTLKHNVSHLQLFRTKYSSYVNNYEVISIHPEHSLVFIVGGVEKTLMSYDMDSRKLCFIRQLGSECKLEWQWWPECGKKAPPFYPHVPLFSESLADEH